MLSSQIFLSVCDSDPETSVGTASVDPDADWRRFPLLDEVQRGVEEECWRRGYAVMIAGATNANSEVVLADLAGRVDGFAVLSDSVADAALRRIAERLPVVVLSESRLSGDFPQVGVDNGSGVQALVEHLVNQHALRELTFVGALVDTDRQERFAAFQAALRAAQLPAPQESLGVTGDYRAMAQELMSHDDVARGVRL